MYMIYIHEKMLRDSKIQLLRLLPDNKIPTEYIKF